MKSIGDFNHTIVMMCILGVNICDLIDYKFVVFLFICGLFIKRQNLCKCLIGLSAGFVVFKYLKKSLITVQGYLRDESL